MAAVNRQQVFMQFVLIGLVPTIQTHVILGLSLSLYALTVKSILGIRSDIAFFFRDTSLDQRYSAESQVKADLKCAIKDWQDSWRLLRPSPKRVEMNSIPYLLAEPEGDAELKITDTRPCAVANEHFLYGLEATVYKRLRKSNQSARNS